MGQANKVKKELKEVVEMSYLVQTLKDIADNKFYSLMAQKQKFRRFGETFVEFFRLISMTEMDHPLMKNDNPVVAYVIVTIEGSFLGEFNNRIIRKAADDAKGYQQSRIIGIGERSKDQLKQIDPNVQMFTEMEIKGIYKTAVEVKDYIVKEVMEGRIGKVFVSYAWAKSMDVQKNRVVKLLPCDELVKKQAGFFEFIEEVIEESTPREIIGYLSNLWITTKLYEIFTNTVIASAAFQSTFLDERVDRMKKEKAKTLMKYRKAKKSDIDKSLRETFTARMIALKG